MAVMSKGLALVLILSFSSCCYLITPSSATPDSDGFLQCLLGNIPSRLIYTQGASNFTNVLASSVRNPRVFPGDRARPLCIVTATDASHIQSAVRCGRAHGVRLRVRSGGHDYEGLSYRSEQAEAFGVVDLAGIRSISVVVSDSGDNTAGKVWGEKYFAGNFRRLAAVKAAVDPNDFFRNEQSIPPFLQGNRLGKRLG
nr:unnamed protein product [Digitaria exilis]